MKKLSTLLIIAFALVLGLTQCKKKVDTIASPSDLGKTVYITVNVGDGDRYNVYPGTGAVVYTDGDKIYVGNGSKYLGTLTYGSGAFSGNIAEPGEGNYLYFYFLGGIEISPVAATTSYEISIANQSSKLPVLSFGRSTSTYTTSTATYGCTLLNKCGLVKFVPAKPTSETVKVGGMKTTATIDFANPGITPTDATDKVTLYAESNEAKWAILLVQGEVSTPTVTIDGYISTITSVPAVTENMYYTTGVSIAMSLPGVPEGAAGGTANARQFSVSDDKHVWFSQGNLQYQASTNTWRFAENQYDYVGNAVGNTAPSSTQSGWIDLFGLGTSGISGYSPIATCYQPWSTSTKNGEYNPYGSNSTNLYDGEGDNKGKADWGYNAISNGGNTQNFGWRTLTSAEWAWVLGPNSGANPGTNCRTSSTVNNIQNARFAKATVNSKAGVIIFPDNYTHPSGVTQPTNINGYTSDYTGNSYDAPQWSSMESAGAVFLPAAGYRKNGTTVDNVGSHGYYWSSTTCSVSSACNVYFNSSKFNPSYDDYRYYGFSVRLVLAFE